MRRKAYAMEIIGKRAQKNKRAGIVYDKQKNKLCRRDSLFQKDLTRKAFGSMHATKIGIVGRTYNRFLHAPYKQAAKRLAEIDVHLKTLIPNDFFQASKLSLPKFNDNYHQNFDEQSGDVEGRQDPSSSYAYKASNGPPQRWGHVSITWSGDNQVATKRHKVHEACCFVFDLGAFVLNCKET